MNDVSNYDVKFCQFDVKIYTKSIGLIFQTLKPSLVQKWQKMQKIRKLKRKRSMFPMASVSIDFFAVFTQLTGFSLIWSSLIIVSSIRDLRISSKIPIDSLMHLYSAFCKSIEGVFRTILFIPLLELTHHATERTYSDPIWPFTTFGDRWLQWMQMTSNNYKSPAMYSATCNKICSYIQCPLINDGNSFEYLLYFRGHYRLLPARAHFVKNDVS